MDKEEREEMLKMWRQHYRLNTKLSVYEVLEWKYGIDIFILDKR